MNNRIRWLRISYWAGALVDAYAVFRWTFPEMFPGSSADIGYNLGMKWGVALMLGWTLLLIWADRKPLVFCGVNGPAVIFLGTLI